MTETVTADPSSGPADSAAGGLGPSAKHRPPDSVVMRIAGMAWLIGGLATFGLAAVLFYRVSFDGARATMLTVVPVVILISMTVGFIRPFRAVSFPVHLLAVVVTIAGWSVLVFDDDRWSILTFALYALAFSSGRNLGIALAAVVSVVWCLAWVAGDVTGWQLVIPIFVLGAGTVMSIALYGADEEHSAQAALIAELRATQRDLAHSQRQQGVLEERARFAGEIHDTLAQGFASIVLLSRATQRNAQWEPGLASIEETAEEHLQAARRLVEAIGPPELDSASLPDALRRQLSAVLGPDITAELQLIGDARPLAGSVEVALLRAAQEALRNIETHADAGEVHVTLTYLDDLVLLDVRDDGVGFVPGTIADRGSLTGGQGLRALEQRTATLGGQLTVESALGGGSVVSVQLPAATHDAQAVALEP